MFNFHVSLNIHLRYFLKVKLHRHFELINVQSVTKREQEKTFVGNVRRAEKAWDETVKDGMCERNLKLEMLRIGISEGVVMKNWCSMVI